MAEDRDIAVPSGRQEIERLAPAPLRFFAEADDFYANPPQAGTGAPAIRVKEIWLVVRQRLWAILLFAIVGTALVAVELQRSKPMYVATTLVEVGEDDSIQAAKDKLIGQDESDAGSTIAIRTSILEISSDRMLSDVVAGLDLNDHPRFLEANGSYSHLEALSSLVGLGGADREKATSGDLIPFDRLALDKEVTPEAALRYQPYVSTLKRNLDVSPMKDTRVLRITFSHTNPAIAASVANGVAQVFEARNFETKTARFSHAASWLDRSTRELKDRVTAAEQALATYMKANDLFAIDGKSDLASDKLTQLYDQVMRSETDLMLKQSLYEEVKAGRVAELPDSFSDKKLSDLQNRLNDLNVVAAQLDVKYGPAHPRVLEVKQQAEEVRRQIAESRSGLEARLSADYERAVRDNALLEKALQEAKGDAIHQNQVAIQMNILRQEVDTAKALYTDFLQKSSQANVVLAEQHNNVRVIEPAKIPGSPVAVGGATVTAGAFLVLFACGVGFVLLLKNVDDTVRTVEDVERYLNLHAVGIIPRISSNLESIPRHRALPATEESLAPVIPHPTKDENIIVFNPGSPIAEAYHALRTSVLHSAANTPPQTILVTSSQPGDGKTTLSVNLAKSLALIGRSVIIVDCDLRKPSAHRILGTNPFSGLSTYLSHEVELESQIRKLRPEGLSLMSSGPLPGNPAELIGSRKVKQLFDELKKRYDHVVIDSPPLTCVSDAIVLATHADGVLLVVESGKTKRDIIRRARREIERVGAPLLGIVLNKLDPRSVAADSYYYTRYSAADGKV